MRLFPDFRYDYVSNAEWLGMPKYDIRDALKQDLVQIVEIYNSNIPSHLATADTQPITIESRLQWFACLLYTSDAADE